MPAAADIQRAEDAAIQLTTRIFTKLNDIEDKATLDALVAKMQAFRSLLDLVYAIENQRKTRP